jgi:hypothetical protein
MLLNKATCRDPTTIHLSNNSSQVLGLVNNQIVDTVNNSHNTDMANNPRWDSGHNKDSLDTNHFLGKTSHHHLNNGED